MKRRGNCLTVFQRFHPRSEAEESEALILWRAHLHDEQYRSGIACRLHFFALEYQRESEETERRIFAVLFRKDVASVKKTVLKAV